MKVLAVGAHPDDVEVSCLGTLLLCRNRGDEIFSIAISRGEAGSTGSTEEAHQAVSERRQAESAAVARAIDAESFNVGLRDQFIFDSPDARLALTEVFRRVAPDLVLGPPPSDYHSDHMTASKLVYDACTLSTVAAVPTAHRPLAQVPALYYVEPIGGLEWQPTHYVDISTVMDRKCELIAFHRSQVAHMRTWGGIDLIEYARTVSAFRGLQCGARHAEGFRPALGWPRVRAGSPLP